MVTPYKPWPVDTVEMVLNRRETYAELVLCTVVHLCLYTGQRIGDVCAMRWDDISGGAIRVRQRKTGTQLTIPLHPRLFRFLEYLKQRHPPYEHGLPYIMPTKRRDGRHDRSTIGLIWRAARKELGIPEATHIHGLRKNCAIALVEGGANIMQVRAITGHRSAGMAEYYCELRDQRVMAESAMKLWRDEGI